MEHGYVSLVPVQFDLTNYELKTKLEKTVEVIMLRKDNLKLGIILGLIAPLLSSSFTISLPSIPGRFDLSEFLGYLKDYKSLLTGVSSISLIANAVLFHQYILI